jgi:hypothetical protein
MKTALPLVQLTGQIFLAFPQTEYSSEADIVR